MLIAAVATFFMIVSTAAQAATITVNSRADPGAAGICTLRDAITSANTMTATNGCAAGTGSDTIRFSVRGTILLGSTLPEITDALLTINGPASPGITIDGGSKVQVMQVVSGAAVAINRLTISNGVTFTSNGGGVANAGILVVTRSTFSKNAAPFTFPTGGGGGIFNGGTLTVINSNFSQNPSGGGIFNGGALTVTNSTFSQNPSVGGIFNYLGTLTVANSTFLDNEGGITYLGFPATVTGATVTGCTFSGNTVAGGISNSGGMDVVNSTFTANTNAVGYGGAILNDGVITVTSSTLFDNPVGGFGQDTGFISYLKGTILSANGPAGSDCSVGTHSSLIDAGYNIADDSSCHFSATGSHNLTDPKLDPSGLRNNGGPTQTIALQSTSPAIDAIPIADCTDQSTSPKPITTDQRGFPRPDAGEQVCDIGAYEFQDFAGQPRTANCTGVSTSALAQQFGTIKAAASALHFPSVQALLSAIRAFCGG